MLLLICPHKLIAIDIYTPMSSFTRNTHFEQCEYVCANFLHTSHCEACRKLLIIIDYLVKWHMHIHVCYLINTYITPYTIAV